MKKFFVISWLTILCFLLLGNVHAWEVPSYVRINSGVRMWFSQLEGDLVEPDRTKLGFTENLGIKKDQLVWSFFTNFRLDNIHLLRFRIEPWNYYDESRNDSSQRITDFRAGYDLDFYMTPQILFGANVDLDTIKVETTVRNVTVGRTTFNYSDDSTRVVPSLGIHGTFYPIMEGISLRPNLSARVNWWNYQDLETWDWEAAAAVDIPINRLWTWCINSGYRFSHIKFKRDHDTLDMNRMGFFLETSVLF